MRVLRDYLATLLPSELESLPKDCRLSGLSTGDEIAEAAVVLTKCELAMLDDPRAPLLHEMALTFNAALQRLRQIRGRGIQL